MSVNSDLLQRRPYIHYWDTVSSVNSCSICNRVTVTFQSCRSFTNIQITWHNLLQTENYCHDVSLLHSVCITCEVQSRQHDIMISLLWPYNMRMYRTLVLSHVYVATVSWKETTELTSPDILYSFFWWEFKQYATRQIFAIVQTEPFYSIAEFPPWFMKWNYPYACEWEDDMSLLE